ncbi:MULTISPECIES: 5-oxoprolinase subunit PxpA [Shewanella]|uniref:5-oxoprolinase subunit PxpA n=1 Tax=Shewanella TaxID=22 RepID=UPI001EFC4805|nr:MULTISPECIES: 5-oxoprolinase subunit PxpA [Shewanella]MCG9748531.1 5-oxoprolinase subunit PxpA [Shewanella sp. Isolate8]MCL2911035.1 5-oxoprolinase subunit PxpA [Shewanella aquimarina]
MEVKPLKIDLNADLGEGGTQDEALLALVTSANVACGGHAGDHQSMLATVKRAKAHHVKVGAHPSYPDRANFGRLSLDMDAEQLFDSLIQQINALGAVCNELGVKLHHVKPHGALYNDAAQDPVLGGILIRAIEAINPNLKLMILAGSPLVGQARRAGLEVIEEAFADRGYLADGTLASRAQPGALIKDTQGVLAQVESIVKQQRVKTLSGEVVSCRATSLCLHGDNPEALEFARAIRASLER